MQSIKDRVAIVGMGCSKFGERWDMGAEDLLVESCYEAFADAGIESKDIQAAWFGTSSLNTGQPLASAIKSEFIPITRVENACATATDAMRQAVIEHKADIGISLDGDADRVLISDEKGTLVDGDQLLALIANSWRNLEQLQGDGVVGTVMANLGLEN